MIEHKYKIGGIFDHRHKFLLLILLSFQLFILLAYAVFNTFLAGNVLNRTEKKVCAAIFKSISFDREGYVAEVAADLLDFKLQLGFIVGIRRFGGLPNHNIHKFAVVVGHKNIHKAFCGDFVAVFYFVVGTQQAVEFLGAYDTLLAYIELPRSQISHLEGFGELFFFFLQFSGTLHYLLLQAFLYFLQFALAFIHFVLGGGQLLHIFAHHFVAQLKLQSIFLRLEQEAFCFLAVFEAGQRRGNVFGKLLYKVYFVFFKFIERSNFDGTIDLIVVHKGHNKEIFGIGITQAGGDFDIIFGDFVEVQGVFFEYGLADKPLAYFEPFL